MLFEGFMDFFKRKRPFEDDNLIDKIKETLFDLTDNGYEIDVTKRVNLLNDDFIEIDIKKPMSNSSHFKDDVINAYFKIGDIKPQLEFMTSFLKDELGLKLDYIQFREIKWTTTKSRLTGGQSGTKKIITYTKVSQIKDNDESWYVTLRFS